MPREKHYGIKVRFATGLWGTYWYGADSKLRDQKYKEYLRMPNVLAVNKVHIKA